MISGERKENPKLSAVTRGGRLSHAYITGEEQTALALAAAAVCMSGGERPCFECVSCKKAARRVHPDIISVGLLPDKLEIVVDQIRAVKEDVFVAPNESEKKAYIIYNADSMNTSAQNALLMVLEDPPRHVMFILIAENPRRLLNTVCSRCVELGSAQAQDTGDTDGGKSAGLAEEFFTALERGQMEFTAFSFTLDKLSRQELSEFITSARKIAGQRMKNAAVQFDSHALMRYSKAEAVLSRAELFASLSVGAVHISGLLCASLL